MYGIDLKDYLHVELNINSVLLLHLIRAIYISRWKITFIDFKTLITIELPNNVSLEHGNYSDTFIRATLHYIWAYLKSPTWSHATLNPPLTEENKCDKSVFTLIFCQTSSLSTLKWFFIEAANNLHNNQLYYWFLDPCHPCPLSQATLDTGADRLFCDPWLFTSISTYPVSCVSYLWLLRLCPSSPQHSLCSGNPA